MTDAERHAREAAAPRDDPATGLAPTEPADPAVEAAPRAVEAPASWASPQPTAAPLASVIAKPTSSSGRGTSLLLALAAAIAVGGIAFAAGRLTAPASTASTTRPGGQFPGGQLPGNGQGFPGRGDAIGGVKLNGTVTAISADSITLELVSGSSITIPLDGETAYRAASVGSAADVTVGSTVEVTPGARVADPAASFDPNATPAPNASRLPGLGGLSFGAATDVTVVEP